MKRFGILVAAMSLMALPALADWSDNFDSYTLGSIDSQGGWKGWANVPADAGYVTGDQYLSYPYSQQIGGPDPVGYTDSVHEYAGYTAGQWTYAAYQYIPSTSETGTTYFILMNNYDDPGAQLSWSIEFSFNLQTGLIDDDFTATPENVAIIRNQWVPIVVNFDLGANTYNAFYGGAPLSSGPWNRTGDTWAQLALEAVDLYTPDASAVYYDGMSVPEPASLGLLALGLLLLRRR
jgi:hypothetical protein